jgi:drug/metabolite transporter (DMT)-like permease
MIQAIITTMLFAMSAVSAGRTTRVLGAGTANLARLMLATVFLGLWAHTGGQGFHGAALPWMVASGLIGFALGDTALYAAYYRIGPRLAVLLCLCLAAPIGAIIEWLWLGTRLTGGQIFWGSAILVGVFAALAPDSRTPVPTRTWLVGIALGVVAALGQGGGAVLTVKAYEVARAAGQHIDGATAAYQRIVAGLVVTAIAVLGHRWRKGPATSGEHTTPGAWRRVWPWVVANALFGPALGVACISWALAVAPTGIVLAIVATTPLVVIPLTMILDGDRPTVRSLAGGALAVLGAAVLAYM